jgi:hypothetical protein
MCVTIQNFERLAWSFGMFYLMGKNKRCSPERLRAQLCSGSNCKLTMHCNLCRCTSHGEAQVAIHSQLASQGTGVSMSIMRIWGCSDFDTKKEPSQTNQHAASKPQGAAQKGKDRTMPKRQGQVGNSTQHQLSAQKPLREPPCCQRRHRHTTFPGHPNCFPVPGQLPAHVSTERKGRLGDVGSRLHGAPRNCTASRPSGP